MKRIACLMVVVFVLVMPGSAMAYLDPGTGSYVLQMLVAAFLGSMFALKIFWGQVKEFLARLFSKKDSD